MKLQTPHVRFGKLLMLTAFLWTPALLFAHPGDGDIHTLREGVLHVLSGWDHILTAALAGLLLASHRRLWSRSSLIAATLLPFLLTLWHPNVSGSTGWAASAGLWIMSLLLMALSAVTLRGPWKQYLSQAYLRRTGLGFALLGLALLQL